MALYAKESDVQQELSRDLGTVEGNAASLSEKVIRENLERAGAQIDARLATTYTTPFNPVPRLIRDIAVDFAAYYCSLIFRENRDFETDLHPVLLRYRRADSLLTQIATGRATIPPDGVEPGTGVGARVVQTVSRPQLFSSDEFDIYAPGQRRHPDVVDYTDPETWAQHDA